MENLREFVAFNCTEDNRCKLFGKPERPFVCRTLQPSEEMCGSSAGKAMRYLAQLECATTPVLKRA